MRRVESGRDSSEGTGRGGTTSVLRTATQRLVATPNDWCLGKGEIRNGSLTTKTSPTVGSPSTGICTVQVV